MKEWWKKAIGYQIYPSTFYDDNQDGIGDLKGIIKKLDYIQTLGINLLWISPFYVSAFDDGGYDVIDHKTIDPRFGTMEDFELLLKEAHHRNIKVVIDLILNHTSDQHPWFLKALEGDKKMQSFYHFRKEKNNWSSFFYESAWEHVDDYYYLHIFSKHMPDLNWENKEVRKEMYDIARFWLDKGVDGFRLDAIAHLAKDPFYASSDYKINAQGYSEDYNKYSNQPHLFSYLNEMKKEVFDHYDCVVMGEVGGSISAKEALRYVNYHSGSLDMLFNFDTNAIYDGYGTTYEVLNTDVVTLKQIFETWIHTYGDMAWYPLYWTNHDQSRVLSTYGNTKYRSESAKMLYTVLLFMGGTPFIYNGDEIGMSNYKASSIDEYTDIKDRNYINQQYGVKSEEELLSYLNQNSRFHARTAMQWDTGKNAGFSNNTTILVNPNYVDVNVEAQLQDENSILNFIKKAIRLRQNEYIDVVLDGYLSFIDKKHEDVFAYQKIGKKKLLVIANFKDKEVIFSHHQQITKIVLSNYANQILQNDNIFLRPFEVMVAEIE